MYCHALRVSEAVTMRLDQINLQTGSAMGEARKILLIRGSR